MKYLVVARHGKSHIEDRLKQWLDRPEGELQMNKLGERLKPLTEGVKESRIAVFHGDSPHLLHSAHQLCVGLATGADQCEFSSDLHEDDDYDVIILVTRKRLTDLIPRAFYRSQLGGLIIKSPAMHGELEPGEASVWWGEKGDFPNTIVNYDESEGDRDLLLWIEEIKKLTGTA